MHPSLSFHSAVVFVDDITVSRRFYTEVLGQTIRDDFGRCIVFDCGLSLWQMPKDHVIARSLEGRQGERATVELCFETTAIDEILVRLRERGVEFLHEIREESWGQRTIRFYDPDSHLIEIGEPLETFVTRLYRELGSVAAVRSKTSVSEGRIEAIIRQGRHLSG
ncbi:VOC family protein [bacterium]|nr:VOC family protein [bacterium]